MANTLHGNFTIYDEEYFGGMVETLAQNMNVFNTASRGALRLRSEALKGYYEKHQFFPRISGMVSRRDLTSSAAQTDKALSTTEIAVVKAFRKFASTKAAISVWKTLGETEDVFSYALGVMLGDHQTADMLTLGVESVEAAIRGVGTDLNYDATGETTPTLTAAHLASGMQKMGDMHGKLRCWLMHSKPFFDLVGADLGTAVTNVTDKVRVTGPLTQALGLPCIVTDEASLVDANGSLTDTYNVLGLVETAVDVNQSESEERLFDAVSGEESISYRFQAEWATNLGCKGFTWDVTNGGNNPTDAALATASNWDQTATSVKDCAGVRIVVE
ncbi:MAG: hypothetical protein GY851_35710 [bacterium]|nr:hypothetical protein [bacterium]